MRHRVPRRLDLLDEAQRLQVGDDALPRRRSGRARGRLPAPPRLRSAFSSKMLICARSVPLADLEVVEVVRRRDLHRARALLRVGVFVGDDRDLAPDQRQLHFRLGLDEGGVALIARVHGDAGVAQHRLGPRRRDDDVVLVVARHLRAERIAEVVHVPGRIAVEHFRQRLRVERLLGIARGPAERALRLDLLDLEVGDRGLELGVPVDEPLVLVDELGVVEIDEDLEHGLRQTLVHGEALAAPVARGAEALQLVEDVPPLSSFHAHTFSTNFSRPSARRLGSCRSMSWRSTTICVAMPA